MMEWTQDLPFSRSYLMIVVAVAVVVGGLAVFGQSSTLALAAAILGLYVLHLFSNWQLASNQRQQWQTLRDVERMLGDLNAAAASPATETGDEPDPASETTGAGWRLTAVGEAPLDSDVGGKEEPDAAGAGGVSAETPGAGGADEGASEAAAPGETAGVEEAGREEKKEGDAGDGDDGTVLVPRQYKLGTVAVVERALTPGEVAQVLGVQDRHPDRKFGDIAVDLGLLGESQLEELLETQREGLYRPEAISRARRDLQEFRREKAEELGTGP